MTTIDRLSVLAIRYCLLYFYHSTWIWHGGLGGAKAYSKSNKLMGLIKKQAETNKLYGAICASPAIALEPRVLLKVYTQHRKQVLLS
jgi:hypothetical protein